MGIIVKADLQEFDPARVYAGIRDGSRAAEHELVQRFQSRVEMFLSVRTKDRDIIAELTQEVLLAALCALREGRLRDPQQLPSFVNGIGRNVFNDFLRRRAREKLDPLPEGQDFPAPAKSVKEREQFEIAQREISNLESTDRKILMMTLVDGMKPGEVAVNLKLSSEVVRQRKCRALRKIAERLEAPSRTPSQTRPN